MQNTSCYFDWAATAPLDEDIIKEALELSINNFGNPSSVHDLGIKAKKILSEARTTASKALNVKPENLYFTSGGTEADYIPLLSLLKRPVAGRILISAIEHPAIREQAEMLKHCGWKVDYVKPNSNGIISSEAVKEALTTDTILACIMAVNNETGAVQPIIEIADMLCNFAKETGKRRTKLHVDCVQAAGKIPLCINHPGIDSAAFSAHKIGGPRGSGLLYLRQPIDSFIRGGGQEQGIRSGTENLFGAFAFAKCLERYFLAKDQAGKIIKTESPQCIRFSEQQQYTFDFIQKISSIKGSKIIPESRKNLSAKDENFSPWIVQVAFSKIPGEVMVRSLSEKGFYISTGSACSAKKMNRPILEAMGVSKEDATNAVRFSFGPKTTKEDMEKLLAEITTITSLFNP